MQKDKFKNKDGSCTMYALACGYYDKATINNTELTLEKDNTRYHVKLFCLVNRTRYLWNSFDTLTEARLNYKLMKRHLKSGFISYDNIEELNEH